MPGILAWGVHLPHRRLDLGTIAAVAGTGGGRGRRTVASYDEDATTMGVEAARLALRMADGVVPQSLWFATVEPSYLDKANSTVQHAALLLRRDTAAYDVLGSVRSSVGALRAAFGSAAPSLAIAAGLRTGLPGSPDEAGGGDAAAALVVGEGDVVADLVGMGSASEEFVDRWRVPGEARSRLWEERFGETRYVELALDAWASSGADVATVDRVVVTGPNGRANVSAARKLGIPAEKQATTFDGSIGNSGAAQPFVALAGMLESAKPNEEVVLVVLADGADVIRFRTTDKLGARTPARTIEAQLAKGAPVSYGKFLAWRGFLPVEPPRRPEPARPSSSAAARNAGWKYGFVGSQDDAGAIHLPPSPHDSQPRPMAGATGTVVTFTVDRLAYSPSPPTVFAVVDFDGGGRLPIELTDLDEAEVQIGTRVEMTFRRLFSADGIHNYFWKARPIR